MEHFPIFTFLALSQFQVLFHEHCSEPFSVNVPPLVQVRNIIYIIA
jgi:hypothetical protein